MSEIDDHHLPAEWVTWKTAIDELEPEDCPPNSARAAAIKCVGILNAFGSSMESVFANPSCTLRDVKIRFYALSFALGLNIIDGRSQTEMAESLGIERATFSKIATSFCAANSLAPSYYMKSAGTGPSYTAARIESIKRNNGKLPEVPHRGRRV